MMFLAQDSSNNNSLLLTMKRKRSAWVAKALQFDVAKGTSLTIRIRAIYFV